MVPPPPPRLRFILRRSVQIAEGLEAARALCARALRAARLRAVNYYCLVPHAAAASRYAASRSGPGLEKPK